jgi:hypothetical protein
MLASTLWWLTPARPDAGDGESTVEPLRVGEGGAGLFAGPGNADISSLFS